MNFSVFNKVKANPEAASVAFLALSAQVFHAQHVFFEAGHAHDWTGTFNAWLYAVAVESAVFFFVLRGWAWVSWGFAVASIGVNVAYYTIAHGPDRGWGFMFDPSMVAQTWFMWLLAIVLPVAVAAFSHAADGHMDTSQKATGGPRWAWAGSLVSSVRSRLERPVAVPDVAQAVTGDPDQELTGKDWSVLRPVPDTDTGDLELGPALADTDLDDTDLSILRHLSAGPDTKTGVASAVGMSPGAMDRTKRGKRTGRLVKLEEAGLVAQDPDSGKWSVRRRTSPVTDGPVMAMNTLETLNGPVMSLNGHGPG